MKINKNLGNKFSNVVILLKRNMLKVVSGTVALLTSGKPAYAMSPLSIDGMSDVAKSLQNFVGYGALLFIAGGVIGAMYGGYQFFQSLRTQDGESKNKSMLEVGAGLGSIAVGVAANVFKAYITVQ